VTQNPKSLICVHLCASVVTLLFCLSAVAAQFARPASDVNNSGLYTTTPLWDKLDEASSDDNTTEILSDNNVSESDGAGFEVQLSVVTDPQSSAGHVLRWRAQKQTGGRNLNISCRLYQGSTPLSATRTLSALGAAYTTDTYTLSAAEADAITDYADLRVRCWTAISGGGAATSSALTWIELELPDAPADQSRPHLIVISN
jgi:hypothetical protein